MSMIKSISLKNGEGCVPKVHERSWTLHKGRAVRGNDLFWGNVFSIGTKFSIWQIPNTAHHAENNIPTEKHGGGRILFSSAGKLVRPEGKTD